MRWPVVLLAFALMGCGAATSSETFSDRGEPLASARLPGSGSEKIIEGPDGQAFMDALVAQGFACGDPQLFTTALQQWNCSSPAADVDGVVYEVVVLGESLTAVRSIDASVDQFATEQADRTVAARFLSFIAETAAFTGADNTAAAVWVSDNRLTATSELEVAGVTYTLRGPAGHRTLEIVPTE